MTDLYELAVGRRRAHLPNPGGGRDRDVRAGGPTLDGVADDGARRAEGGAQTGPDPRRTGARAAGSEQGAGPTPGAHVRAERRVRGGRVQETSGGAVSGASDPVDQGARWEDVGRVGRVV